MLTSESTATPDPDVLYASLEDGEAVLLHLGGKTYFSLNETGYRIWRLMSEGRTIGAISQELEAEFELSLADAERSVMGFLERLAGESLVHVDGQ